MICGGRRGAGHPLRIFLFFAGNSCFIRVLCLFSVYLVFVFLFILYFTCKMHDFRLETRGRAGSIRLVFCWFFIRG